MARILAAWCGAASLRWLSCSAITLTLAVLVPARASETPDQIAARLVAAMTQAEKLRMLHGVFAASPGTPRPPGALGSAGFVPGVKRLGIPDLQETDAGLGLTNPYGVRPGDTAVALPSGLAVAASFDPNAAYADGAVLGREAAARRFNVVLGGGVNLVRDPRGGRQFEYAGEDPLLAGMMVGAELRGAQDQHVVATVKHFAANDQETGRSVLSVDMAPAALRESDFLAFEIAIEQGQPGAVMCAYNRVDRQYACGNAPLLTGVLKEDWRYPGWVMSDWGAVHGTDAINAGLDQESGQELDTQTFFGAPLEKALADGQVKQARVDDAVRRILRSLASAGVLTPHANHDDTAADLHIARDLATEGIVELRNTGVLPLPKTLRRVCIFGGQADAGVPAGGGSSQVTPVGGIARRLPPVAHVEPPSFAVQVFDPPSPLSRIQARMPHAEVRFDDGSDVHRAATLAASCEAAIVFATDFSGEEIDRGQLGLPGRQDTLIASVAAANSRTVVVLETAGAVTMPWLERTGAVLEAWYSGSGGADAIADLLSGDALPSGRLPVSFPQRAADLPNPVLPGEGLPPGQAFNLRYPEGAEVGYRWYAQTGKAPLFPFGAGLSGTHFTYGGLHVIGGEQSGVSFEIRNGGQRKGVAVPQLYLTARQGRSMRRLLAWSRQVLEKGASTRVELKLDARLMAEFDDQARRWLIPAGRMTLAVCDSATECQQSTDVMAQRRTLPP